MEIKGIGSSVSIDSYYKTIGYAGLFINQTGRRNQYSGLDISLTLLSSHYPRKLMKHLLRERNLRVVKPFPGVYYINKETFTTQIIVTKELSSKDNLYLRCLTNHLEDSRLANRLAKDYGLHQEDELYTRYMQQITTANLKRTISLFNWMLILITANDHPASCRSRSKIRFSIRLTCT